MTLLGHALCSVLLAEFSMRKRYGWRGALLVVIAGTIADIDAVSHLFGADAYRDFGHAVGHSLPMVALLSLVVALIGSWAFQTRPERTITWCLVAGLLHVVVDLLYGTPIKLLWPASSFAVSAGLIEFFDLVVLGICVLGGLGVWLFRKHGGQIAIATFIFLACYVGLRLASPEPEGTYRLITGGWVQSRAVSASDDETTTTFHTEAESIRGQSQTQ